MTPEPNIDVCDCPVNVRTLMGNRHEHIQRTHVLRCQCVIRDTGILHVERRIFRQNLQAIDLVKIFFIVLRNVDRVMRQIVISPFDAQIQHEGRTRVLAAFQLSIVPSTCEVDLVQAAAWHSQNPH